MRFEIDRSSAVPPFEQVRAQIVAGVTGGTLRPGAKLPTVRGLAESLGIAANTVARSYRDLERDGVIETRGRNGSFVAVTGDAAHREARAAANEFAERIRQLRVESADAIALVREALES